MERKALIRDGRASIDHASCDMHVISGIARRARHRQAVREEIPVFRNEIEQAQLFAPRQATLRSLHRSLSHRLDHACNVRFSRAKLGATALNSTCGYPQQCYDFYADIIFKTFFCPDGLDNNRDLAGAGWHLDAAIRRQRICQLLRGGQSPDGKRADELSLGGDSGSRKFSRDAAACSEQVMISLDRFPNLASRGACRPHNPYQQRRDPGRGRSSEITPGRWRHRYDSRYQSHNHASRPDGLRYR
jgi:hypothetical protein